MDKRAGLKQGNNLGTFLLPRKSLFLTLTLMEPPHPHQEPAKKHNPVFSLPSMTKITRTYNIKHVAEVYL